MEIRKKIKDYLNKILEYGDRYILLSNKILYDINLNKLLNNKDKSSKISNLNNNISYKHFEESVANLAELEKIETSFINQAKIQKIEILNKINSEVVNCKKCLLFKTRKNTVFGEGNIESKIVFVGEAPGQEEDIQGRPFVGKAGKLLDKILLSLGIYRNEVYICNILKCRPPANRDPEPEEIKRCFPYLRKQLEILAPEVIVCLGKYSAIALIGNIKSLSQVRGKVFNYNNSKVIVTYHPAFIIRTPSYEKVLTDDLRIALRLLNNKI